jgi:dihydrofolate synthase/folylpolyglutamate synthase
MDYRQSLDYLLSFADFERSGRFSSRPDVAPVRALLRHLGDPQRGRLTVHVAGSKGKGSTAAMAAAILRECGLKVGLYTSPHLHSFCERIRIDGEPISAESFGRQGTALPAAVVEVRREFPERELVTFDLLTAMGFLAFREAGASVQVIETGLGGRVDSTNAVERKEVCVITRVSLEHQEILGDTLAAIAAEKAGIIGDGAAVVMGLQDEAAASVIRRTAVERGARLVEVGEACRISRLNHSLQGQDFRLRTPSGEHDLHLPLLGRHQLENAATAVLAVEALREHGVDVSASQIERGLAGVRWPARLEVLRERPLLVVDGAHNAESARRLRETLAEEAPGRRAILVVGASRDKDVEGMAAELAPAAKCLIATSSRHPRALPAEAVAAVFAEQGVVVTVISTVAEAVDAALAGAEADDVICVAGSLFVAAEARAHVLGIEEEVGVG